MNEMFVNSYPSFSPSNGFVLKNDFNMHSPHIVKLHGNKLTFVHV